MDDAQDLLARMRALPPDSVDDGVRMAMSQIAAAWSRRAPAAARRDVADITAVALSAGYAVSAVATPRAGKTTMTRDAASMRARDLLARAATANMRDIERAAGRRAQLVSERLRERAVPTRTAALDRLWHRGFVLGLALGAARG